jgi:hypothetical protein
MNLSVCTPSRIITNQLPESMPIRTQIRISFHFISTINSSCVIVVLHFISYVPTRFCMPTRHQPPPPPLAVLAHAGCSRCRCAAAS